MEKLQNMHSLIVITFKSFLVINATSMNSLLLYQNLHVVKGMGVSADLFEQNI